MKIAAVTSQVLVWPPFDPPFWMSLLPVTRGNELVVRVTSDDGHVGIGHTDQLSGAFAMDRSGTPKLGNSARIVPEALSPILVGKDPMAIESLWQEMFAVTYRHHWSKEGWSHQQVLGAMAAVDMALWDLKGKILGVPVHRLLGSSRNRIACYLAGGYYRDGKTLADLEQEMKVYREQGYQAIKMRVGGASLDEDVERVATAREALGPDIKLMVDANEAYDSETAIRAAARFAAYNLYWFEDPARWYEGVEGLKRVAERIDIPLAGGERVVTHWEAANVIDHAGLGFMQFDGMRTGGPSEWLKVAQYCDARGIPMAPHHGPIMHAHLVAAVRNGVFVEVFADPFLYADDEARRWVRWDKKRELFAVHPEIENGDMILSDRPGFGFELDEDVVAKCEVRE